SLKEDPDYRDTITGVKDGVVISAIPPGTPAKRSELRPGDVITAVDGKPVTTAQELKGEIRSKTIGAPVVLDVHRFGKNIKMEVKPEGWPDELRPVASRRAPNSEDKASSLGLTVQPLTQDLAEQYEIEKMEGVVVSEVEAGSAADRKGIRVGDVIAEV